ncbi:hypothetical protein [Candidatus Sodalis endolongispinus]|nr:hypothetical protein [Candidatus Sodalis endolongispinus]
MMADERVDVLPETVLNSGDYHQRDDSVIKGGKPSSTAAFSRY